jgi:hypothetical protein
MNAAVMILLGTTQAAPYNLGTPNSAFYLPSGSSPSVIPSACITWDVATSGCLCTTYSGTPSTMMVDPSSILPGYYLKTFFG